MSGIGGVGSSEHYFDVPEPETCEITPEPQVCEAPRFGSPLPQVTPLPAEVRLQPVTPPNLTDRQIEQGLKGTGPKHDEAVLALTAKWQQDPETAWKFLKDLPPEKVFATAHEMMDQLGFLRGDYTCRAADNELVRQVEERAAKDPALAGQWLGLALQGKLPYPPGVPANPRAAIEYFRSQFPKVPPEAAAKAMLDFVNGQFKTGGLGSLASTLKELSKDGPSDSFLAYLKALRGHETGRHHYLAEMLTARGADNMQIKIDTAQAISQALDNVALQADSSQGAQDRAGQVLGSVAQAVGDRPAALREFKKILEDEELDWGGPNKKGFLDPDYKAQKEEATKTVESLKTTQSFLTETEQEIKKAFGAKSIEETIRTLENTREKIRSHEFGAKLTVGGEAGFDIGILEAKLSAALELAYTYKRENRTSETEVNTLSKTTEFTSLFETLNGQKTAVGTELSREESREKSLTLVTTGEGRVEGLISGIQDALRKTKRALGT